MPHVWKTCDTPGREASPAGSNQQRGLATDGGMVGRPCQRPWAAAKTCSAVYEYEYNYHHRGYRYNNIIIIMMIHPAVYTHLLRVSAARAARRAGFGTCLRCSNCNACMYCLLHGCWHRQPRYCSLILATLHRPCFEICHPQLMCHTAWSQQRLRMSWSVTLFGDGQEAERTQRCCNDTDTP